MQLLPLTTNNSVNVLIERAFVRASKRFPYWQQPLMALTPMYVEIKPGDKKYNVFSFAVTEGGTMIVSDMMLRLKWTPGAVGTVIVHEMLHLWQRHRERARANGVNLKDQEQAEIWNLACDCEINDDLREAGCEFPRDPEGQIMGVFPETFQLKEHLTAEEYYKALMAQAAQGDQPDKSKMFSKAGCGGGQGAKTEVEIELQDELDASEDASEDAGQDAGEDAGEGEGAGAGTKGGVGGVDKTPAQMADIFEAMDAAVEQAVSTGRGNVPGGFAKIVASRSKTTVDWRAKLAAVTRRACESVKGSHDVNWGRLSRRSLGAFLRPTATDRKPKVVIALDTSGSMAGFMTEAVTQVEGVMDAVQAELTYIQCDMRIAKVLKVKRASEIANVKIHGWGGTDFRPVFDLVGTFTKREQPDILIYITDGEGDAPRFSPKYKVIWALVGGRQPPATWGTPVMIPKGG